MKKGRKFLIQSSEDPPQGGREKMAALINEPPKAIDLPVPEKYGNDPGGVWKRIDLKEWLEAGLFAI